MILVLFFSKLNLVLSFFISGGVPDSNPQPIHDGQPSQSTDFFEPIVSQSVNPSCENEDFG
jgi:hypothetical protein